MDSLFYATLTIFNYILAFWLFYANFSHFHLYCGSLVVLGRFMV